jgi:hypothetical protein
MDFPKKSFKNTLNFDTTRVGIVFGLQNQDFPTLCSIFGKI